MGSAFAKDLITGSFQLSQGVVGIFRALSFQALATYLFSIARTLLWGLVNFFLVLFWVVQWLRNAMGLLGNLGTYTLDYGQTVFINKAFQQIFQAIPERYGSLLSQVLTFLVFVVYRVLFWVYLALRNILRELPLVALFVALGVIYFLVFFPMLTAEADPQQTADLGNQVVHLGGTLFNVLAGVWNVAANFAQPILPLYNVSVAFILRSFALVWTHTLKALGLENVFEPEDQEINTSNWGPLAAGVHLLGGGRIKRIVQKIIPGKVQKQAVNTVVSTGLKTVAVTGTRRLLQDVFSQEEEADLGIPEDFWATWQEFGGTVIINIARLVDLAQTLALTLLEFYLEFFAQVAFKIVNFLGKILGSFACCQLNGWCCFVEYWALALSIGWDFVLQFIGPILAFFQLYNGESSLGFFQQFTCSSVTDPGGQPVTCKCSANYPEGLFTNVGSCPATESSSQAGSRSVICVERNGIWEEYLADEGGVAQGPPISANKDPALGCPNSNVGGGRRLSEEEQEEAPFQISEEKFMQLYGKVQQNVGNACPFLYNMEGGGLERITPEQATLSVACVMGSILADSGNILKDAQVNPWGGMEELFNSPPPPKEDNQQGQQQQPKAPSEEPQLKHRAPAIRSYLGAFHQFSKDVSALPRDHRILRDEKILGGALEKLHDNFLDLHEYHFRKLSGRESGVRKLRGAIVVATQQMQRISRKLLEDTGTQTAGESDETLQEDVDLGVWTQEDHGECPYRCPDGKTCVEQGELQRCPEPQEFPLVTSLRYGIWLVDMTISSVGEALLGLVRRTLDCWNEYEENPRTYPYGIEQVNLEISDLSAEAKRVRQKELVYCFPLVKRIPVIPRFTWSFNQFLAEGCEGLEGTQTRAEQIHRCTCPEWEPSADSFDRNRYWVPGSFKYVQARLLNTWHSINIFLRGSQGVITSRLAFCGVLHLGSVAWTLGFMLFPLFIYFKALHPTVWRILLDVFSLWKYFQDWLLNWMNSYQAYYEERNEWTRRARIYFQERRQRVSTWVAGLDLREPEEQWEDDQELQQQREDDGVFGGVRRRRRGIY